MQLSHQAQQIRELADRLAQIGERNEPETQEPKHEITSSELMRLKVALKPLVSDDMQGRFLQVMNKMRSETPITTGEAKLITMAFISMADIIATDNVLIQRLRKDIADYNVSHEEPSDEEGDEITANVKPDFTLPR